MICTDYDPWSWFEFYTTCQPRPEKPTAKLDSREYMVCQSRLSGRLNKSRHKDHKCLPGQTAFDFPDG